MVHCVFTAVGRRILEQVIILEKQILHDGAH